MNQTFVPTAPRNIAARALSPDVAMVSQASCAMPNSASCVSIPLRARGELLTSATVPPFAR